MALVWTRQTIQRTGGRLPVYLCLATTKHKINSGDRKNLNVSNQICRASFFFFPPFFLTFCSSLILFSPQNSASHFSSLRDEATFFYHVKISIMCRKTFRLACWSLPSMHNPKDYTRPLQFPEGKTVLHAVLYAGSVFASFARAYCGLFSRERCHSSSSQICFPFCFSFCFVYTPATVAFLLRVSIFDVCL